jgi:mycothiol synthase
MGSSPITMRPYRGETDLPLIVDLLEACEAVDQLEQWTSIAELRLSFDEPLLDKERDLRFWEDADKLVGFGQLGIPESGEIVDGFLIFRVHPEARGGEIEQQIFAWAEERLREVGQERGLQAKLRSNSREDQSDRIAILERNGLSVDRCFLTLSRSLAEPISEPCFPRGFTMRTVRGEEDAAAWVDLHNQSFIDHWNYHPLTLESYKHWWGNDPDYRPDLDLVAVAADGTLASCCFCGIYPGDNMRTGRQEGWVGILGTRRGFRRLGLARAMLLSGLHQLKAAGMDTAKIGVDADNPLGARQLYESVGFQKLHTKPVYAKDL